MRLFGVNLSTVLFILGAVPAGALACGGYEHLPEPYLDAHPAKQIGSWVDAVEPLDESGECEVFEGEGCFWMENTSGHYCWVPAPYDFEGCFAADSCDGGLSYSGGGCYKWADGSQGQRHSW